MFDYSIEEGWYKAKVIELENKLSSNGNPMWVIKMECSLDNGGIYTVTDYVVHKATWKIQAYEQEADCKMHDLVGVNLWVRLEKHGYVNREGYDVMTSKAAQVKSIETKVEEPKKQPLPLEPKSKEAQANFTPFDDDLPF